MNVRERVIVGGNFALYSLDFFFMHPGECYAGLVGWQNVLVYSIASADAMRASLWVLIMCGEDLVPWDFVTGVQS